MPYCIHHHSFKRVVCLPMLCDILHNLNEDINLNFLIQIFDNLLRIVGHVLQSFLNHQYIVENPVDFFQLCIALDGLHCYWSRWVHCPRGSYDDALSKELEKLHARATQPTVHRLE